MADIGRTTMTVMGHTSDQHMAETTTLMMEIKTRMQLCAITVANLDILQENAIVIQSTSVVITFYAGIAMADSHLGLALANKMVY